MQLVSCGKKHYSIAFIENPNQDPAFQPESMNNRSIINQVTRVNAIKSNKKHE